MWALWGLDEDKWGLGEDEWELFESLMASNSEWWGFVRAG